MKRHKHFIVISAALGLLLTGLFLCGLSAPVAGTPADIPTPTPSYEPVFWSEYFWVNPPNTYITATTGSGVIEDYSFLLTQDITSQAGRIFYLTPTLMDEFNASFSLYLGSKDADGADGAAFIFCPEYDYTQNVGGTLDATCPGGYIVGFDTYETGDDTVYIAFNDYTNRLYTVGVGNLENDQWYQNTRVIFNQGTITVTLDGSNVIDGFTIPDYEPFIGYFGFSAATGGASNVQMVDNINITVPSGQLDGHVYDGETLEPIAGADVTVERQEGGSWNTLTDPSGYYSMTLATGTYTVTAETDTQIDFATGVEVLEEAVTSQDLYLIDKVTFEPTPLHVTLDWQTTDSVNAMLENRQPWAYDFEFFEIPSGFLPAVQGEEVCSTLAAWPGPDGYGYTGGSVNFRWIEISSSGTLIPELSDDDFEGPFPIGFNFNFYGNAWIDFYASSNGFISFGSGSTSLGNQCPLPNSSLPDNIISIMWDDLYPNYGTGGVYYQTFDNCPMASGKCLIVEYANWAHCCNSTNSSGTWEAILFENGDIQLQYLDGGSEDGSSATSGIEGDDASANYGLTYACNSSSLVDETAIYFTYPNVTWFGQEPLTGTVHAGNSEPGELSASMLFTATYAVGVDQPGDYYATLRIHGDPTLQVPVTMTVLPPVDMGSVTGSVTDNCIGEPMAEVRVAIPEGDPIDKTWSDDDGNYTAWLYPGSYELTFSADGYLSTTEKVDIFAGQETSLDVKLVPERACIQVYPQELEAWVLTDTTVFTHPTGLDISNNGGLELNFGLFESEGLPTMLSTDGNNSITSLSGSYVEFDPSEGGDAAYLPGAEQTFCFRAESFTDDWEYVNSLWERFPEDWVVHAVDVQGTPTCDVSSTWGEFSWEYYKSHDYEIQINHFRQQSSTDHCTATYCFEVTSGAGGGAPVSWYWDGDNYGGTPHHPCSDDGYTPEDQPACDEAINPPAWVPEYEFDVPWLWEEPTGGTVPALSTFNVDILFSSAIPDPLPVGTYSVTLWITENDPVAPWPQLPVSMHVVEAFIDPVPSFESNEPLCLGETAVFTNTSVEGMPPTEYYLWDFGDGETMTSTPTETVTHDYAAAGSYTVSLTAHQRQTDVEVVFTDTIEVKPLPLADFSYTMDGLTVAFSNASANATSYAWDFGDSGSSDLENPTHTYDSAGVYTVGLTASGECGVAYIEKTIAVGYIFLPLVYP